MIESVGEVCKAKAKYLKLVYVYHRVRKSGYAYELCSGTDIFVVSALVKVAIAIVNKATVCSAARPGPTNTIVNSFPVLSNANITQSSYYKISPINIRRIKITKRDDSVFYIN